LKSNILPDILTIKTPFQRDQYIELLQSNMVLA